MRFQKI